MKARKFIPLIVVAAGLLAYHNSFSGPFVFDDLQSIRDNPTIRHLWPIWQALSPPHQGGLTVEGRPLINLSFAVNYAIGGADIHGYHIANLIIHILAGLTLFGLVRRTLLLPNLRDRFGAVASELALAVAVLWTVHPLQTESVTYIVQRAESLMGLFYLLTLYCFVRGAASSRRDMWYDLCLIACTLGMACKEVMASAPLMVLLYDRTFVSGSFRESWHRHRSLYQALAGTWILTAWLMLGSGNRGGSAGFGSGGILWWQYALTQCWALTHYLWLSVWPSPLVFDYGTGLVTAPARVIPGALILAALLAGTALALVRRPQLGFLGAWFFLILAPTSTVIPVASQTIAEHRMYLPLAAVVTLIVMGIYTVLGRRSLPIFLALAVGLGFLTTQRNEVYRTATSLWIDTIAKRPGDARAYYGLGRALNVAGRMPEAIEQYEHAILIKPDYGDAHNNLGLALLTTGKVQPAMVHLEQALRINPHDAGAHNNLAIALSRVGRIQEAISHCQEALRINPDFPEAQYNLAKLLARQSTGATP